MFEQQAPPHPEGVSENEPTPGMPPQELTLHIRRPEFWSPKFRTSMLLVAVVSIGLLVAGLPDLNDIPGGWRVWDVLRMSWFPVALPLLVLAVRWWRRRKPVPPIRFYAERVELPLSIESPRKAVLAYRDIRDLDVQGKGEQARLLVSTDQRVFVFPRRSFWQPGGFELALKQLHAGVMAQPDGVQLMQSMGKKRQITALALSNRAVVTHVLLVLLLGVFLFEYMRGAMQRPFGLVPFGANAPVLVQEQGEIFRLIASTFLHGNLIHFYFNALALFFLGSILERLLGWARFSIIYGLSALAASLGSLWGTAGLFSVGASGGLFGLLGGLAIVNWRFRQQLPLGFRQPGRWWLLILSVNAVLPLVFQNIDFWAHLVGFLAGGVVAWLVVEHKEALNPKRRTPAAVAALAALLIIVYLAGLSTAMQRAAAADHNDELDFARVVLRSPNSSAVQLNNVAYTLALDTKATADDLQLALRAARRALQTMPQEPMIVDTVAALAFRNGETREAIRLQKRALDAARTASGSERGWLQKLLGPARTTQYATQLGRFLDAHHEEKGVWRDGVAGDVRLRLASAEAPKTRQLEVDVAPNLSREDGLVVFALADSGGDTVGLLRVAIGPQKDDVDGLEPPHEQRGWREVDSVATAWISDDCASCASGSADLDFWYFEPAVPSIPTGAR